MNDCKYLITRLACDLEIRVESVYRYCREYDAYFQSDDGMVWLRIYKMAA